MDITFLVFDEAVLVLKLLLERRICSIGMPGPFSELRRCDCAASVLRLCSTHLEVLDLFAVWHKEEDFDGLELCELRSGLALIPQKAAGVVVEHCGIYPDAIP